MKSVRKRGDSGVVVLLFAVSWDLLTFLQESSVKRKRTIECVEVAKRIVDKSRGQRRSPDHEARREVVRYMLINQRVHTGRRITNTAPRNW